jgi:hypothetical protein
MFLACEKKAKTLNLATAKILKELFVQELAFNSALTDYDLIDLLKQCAKQQDLDLWWVLGTWLKQHGIRQPKDFLPPKIYNKLTRDSRVRIRPIRFRELVYSANVEAWLPYFQRLYRDLAEKKKTIHRPTEALIDDGYEEAAVRATSRKHRAISAVFEWLAPRLHIEVETLKNAYSIWSSRAKSQNRISHLVKHPVSQKSTP